MSNKHLNRNISPSDYNFEIPSFNPSPSESRKSADHDFELRELNDKNKRNFQKKEKLNKGDEHNKKGKNKLLDKKNSRFEQFWEQLYNEQNNTYKTLQNKFNLLEESIKLHKQALSLRNSENIENEERILSANARIRNLSNKTKENEQRIKNISDKCQEVQQGIINTIHKIENEETILEEERKHIKEINERILSMKKDICDLEAELQINLQKENEYFCILEDNEQLLKHLNSFKNEISLARIKADKDTEQEESMGRKMKELEKIIIKREKSNRELGKNLIELRKLYPEANHTKNRRNHNKEKIEDIMKNIKEMETEFSKIQQEIFETDKAMEETSLKLKDKMKSVDNLKLRYKASIQELDESYKSNEKENRQIFENHSFGMQLPYPSKHLEKMPISEQDSRIINFHEQNPKPLGYRVIESEENEEIFYPKQTEPNLSDAHSNQGTNDKKSQIPFNSSKERHYEQNEIKMEAESGRKGKNLVMTDSIKNLLSRYENIKTNSIFKK